MDPFRFMMYKCTSSIHLYLTKGIFSLKYQNFIFIVYCHLKNILFLSFYSLVNQIVVTFGEAFYSELYAWMGYGEQLPSI